jgi:hypothetical protein
VANRGGHQVVWAKRWLAISRSHEARHGLKHFQAPHTKGTETNMAFGAITGARRPPASISSRQTVGKANDKNDEFKMNRGIRASGL